jgi:hypothetical protein
VSGLQIAHTRGTVNAQAELSSTMKSVELNAKIDPAVFAKPAS